MDGRGELIWRILQVLAWFVLGLVFYFTEARDVGQQMAALEVRQAVIEARSLETERKTNNELTGYQELLKGVGLRLDEVNQRLSRMEGRLERR